MNLINAQMLNGIREYAERRIEAVFIVRYSLFYSLGPDRVVCIATRCGCTTRRSIPGRSIVSSPTPVQNGRGFHPASSNGYHGSSGSRVVEALHRHPLPSSTEFSYTRWRLELFLMVVLALGLLYD
jgi:hypothetical protein